MFLRLLKRFILSLALIVFIGDMGFGQALEFMDLGVLEGEFKRFKRTITWTNRGEKDVDLNLWTDHSNLKFEEGSTKVRSGESIDIPINIALPTEAGDYEYELRLLDGDDFLLHGYQLTFKVLQGELDVFKAYRNVYWPFRTKEEVFNLKAGYRGDTLKAQFDVYNLGGEDLLDLDKLTVSDSIQVSFSSDQVNHHQFAQMQISFASNDASQLGFQRKIVKIYQESKLLVALPIQYTLLPRTDEPSGARLYSNIINYDFKVIKVGQSKDVVISLANNGNELLEIEKMESNCDCLAFNQISSISPGSSQRLRVTFNAKGRLGLEKKTIAIFSNDPKKPVQVLSFRAHVK
ncbi:DUF1573 domain-containing protein [Roseivirga misakiensis]|uniref:DUF1573 domain-containing protein n=1 Tax=Roseivirga misakiensis TaxID=1563681 RepID=A0A1E5T0R7_9BACT|nr:DUF1573 domain-containing protein [Roseivirga misakiensis]OEK04897.1 hypothetical protein BFP71_15780 [Roseivirga misakiensis]